MANCDIRIWHTLAEVELFVFLFVIKLLLNCCCSIDVVASDSRSATYVLFFRVFFFMELKLFGLLSFGFSLFGLGEK